MSRLNNSRIYPESPYRSIDFSPVSTDTISLNPINTDFRLPPVKIPILWKWRLPLASLLSLLSLSQFFLGIACLLF